VDAPDDTGRAAARGDQKICRQLLQVSAVIALQPSNHRMTSVLYA